VDLSCTRQVWVSSTLDLKCYRELLLHREILLPSDSIKNLPIPLIILKIKNRTGNIFEELLEVIFPDTVTIV
jgi:hypothetical protein